MTEEQLATQIGRAVEKSLVRFETAHPDSTDEQRRSAVAEFLSGANQVASFLVRGDGLCTPQQIERAIGLVGLRLGLHQSKA